LTKIFFEQAHRLRGLAEG